MAEKQAELKDELKLGETFESAKPDRARQLMRDLRNLRKQLANNR